MRSLLLPLGLAACVGGGVIPPDATPSPTPEPTPEPTPDPVALDPCEGAETHDGDLAADGGLCADNVCLTVTGDLTVDGGVAPVSCVVEVAGDAVVFGYAGELLDLSGLTRVGGSLSVTRGVVRDLRVPTALTEVGGDLVVDESRAVLSAGFESLRSVGGRLELAVLGGPASFPVLERAGEVEVLGTDISAIELPALTTTRTLSLLWFAGLDALGDVGALSSVEEIVVEGLETATSLGGLRAPADVPGRVEVTESPVLADVTALGGLRRGGTLLLRNLYALDDVTPLHGIESLTGDLIIEDCTSLPRSEALALRDAIGVENIGGFITIKGNAPD